MKTTTDFFHEEMQPFILFGKTKGSSNRCRVKFDGVKIATVTTPWYHSDIRTEDDIVQFRTVFNLYKSETNYFLEIIGESSDKERYIDKVKILVFTSPSDFSDKLFDTEYKEIYPSDYIVYLLDILVGSKYLTYSEREEWESVITASYI